MKRKLIGLVTILVVATILGACSNYKFEATTEYEIEDFETISHRGETVTLESLKGKPWLAMFIFTSCTTVCQPMTFNMSEIQKELIERDVEDYNIVAFSVDPAIDTPEKLSEYLSFFEIPDETKWNLVTGYDQSYIEQFALNNFKALVKKPQEGDQVMHGTSFYLVDEKGIAVKNYSGLSQDTQEVPYETIAIDMKTLIKERLDK
ncbi:protein SCO1/2 [Ureibacillus xyleni]|uniref:Protein SCO1/2 n=1 Tax=Ureibacillus xyleni TaxID=614648 RepID=A0A285TMS2_9BACL|nr:SCO family protein [Ureibacillus xyleni]SOC21846.1 protein SCO1/2 [Ureibacillus xyleni]